MNPSLRSDFIVRLRARVTHKAPHPGSPKGPVGGLWITLQFGLTRRRFYDSS